MKWNSGWLIVGLLLAAGGCNSGGSVEPSPAGAPNDGGGGAGGPSSGGGDGTGGSGSVIGLGQCSTAGDHAGAGRIWVGDVQDGESEVMRLLIAETGEFRWLAGDGWFQQMFGTFQADSTGVSSTDAVWVWVDGLTFLETRSTAVNLWATLSDPGSLTIEYQSATDPSHAGMSTLAACDSVYLRESSLAILAGSYTGLWDSYSLAIDDGGAVFYQNSRTNCVGNGSAGLIDPAHNMYRMEIELENCTAELAVALNGLTFTGLGYLGDSGDGAINDFAEFALSSEKNGWLQIWNLVGRR